MPALFIKHFASAPPARLLPPRCVHLWQARLPGVQIEDALTAKDFAEAAGFVVEREHSAFLRLRALVRSIGSQYLGVHPAEISCGRDGGGTWLRARARQIRYASESAGEDAALAFSQNQPVALSLETIDPSLAFDDLAAAWLPPEEAWPILVARGGERARLFFNCWTRAEVSSGQPGRRVETFSPHANTTGALELPGPDWTVEHLAGAVPVHLAA